MKDTGPTARLACPARGDNACSGFSVRACVYARASMCVCACVLLRIIFPALFLSLSLTPLTPSL